MKSNIPLFTGASDSEVRLRLAQDDARAIESGTRQVVHNHVAPGLFIYHGLEFEELQCVMVFLAKKV